MQRLDAMRASKDGVAEGVKRSCESGLGDEKVVVRFDANEVGIEDAPRVAD